MSPSRITCRLVTCRLGIVFGQRGRGDLGQRGGGDRWWRCPRLPRCGHVGRRVSLPGQTVIFLRRQVLVRRAWPVAIPGWPQYERFMWHIEQICHASGARKRLDALTLLFLPLALLPNRHGGCEAGLQSLQSGRFREIGGRQIPVIVTARKSLLLQIRRPAQIQHGRGERIERILLAMSDRLKEAPAGGFNGSDASHIGSGNGPRRLLA
jgi:hypothetical protein